MKDLNQTKIEKEIKKIESLYKDCGFEFNHYSREKNKGYVEVLPKSKNPLYKTKWICGVDTETCPQCKSRITHSLKLSKLKAKLEGYKLAKGI